ncbi:MAPK-activated protein kinase Srk1, partial [Elasticomyces elasticus]
MSHDSVFVFGFAEPQILGQDAKYYPRFNLFASPQDIIDTWGPGNFVVAPDINGEQKIVSILVGGGGISLAAEQHNIYHWSSNLRKAFAREPTMRLTEKIVVAASISVNLNCDLEEEYCLKFCDEYRDPLGTFVPYWMLVEQQAGIQVGQYASLIYNQTWAKRTGTTLKELQMLQPIDQVIPFLESTWGLQVSFSSGLARRVKMRELLAEVLPTFVERKVPPPPLWKELRDSHGFLDLLRQGDLAVWFCQANINHRACYDLACALIRSIAMILHDTGIDPSGKHFVLAWIRSQMCIPLQYIKLPVENINYWTIVLQDSSDCATFAYLTTACLQIQGRGCR